ncbi:glycoside hydrolase family 36 protein [Nocardioides halotolerans]|jgi:alpha-galactosidase|uniref:glycoside hydrolase family 36 protein n=1 Tax=Nocardioides halotolerans TaxID=433660 RepID=UPI00041A4FF8|nr:glycoside hydrolase family 36 protein [Nocardioides halotolerans]
MSEVVDEIPVDPASARVYAEGWQSWSPAAWHTAGATGPAPTEEWQHLMRFRPGTPVATDGLQGEGLLVVDPGRGEPVRLYGATDPVRVPTLHARLVADHVVVEAGGPVHTTTAPDAETALAAYASELGGRPTAPPRVWCSWYRYFEQVTAADVVENLRDLERLDLPVDVVQVDDGWSPGLGEGLVESDGFGSLAGLVDTIRGSGRRAGLWLAPFLVGRETTLAREHPDWLTGPAGRNWGQELAGLDLTHPAVRELLASHLHRLVGHGIDYLKLDFLYAGALSGEAAYRSALELVREAVGPDVYLVGCGAPLLPSVGLVDAMRVSPDTFHEGGEDGSTGLRGLMPLAARAWQQGRLWVNDPDCVVARPSYSQRERWAGAARRFGGLRSFSDRICELDEWGLAAVRDLLADGGLAEPLPLAEVRAGAALAQDEAAT